MNQAPSKNDSRTGIVTHGYGNRFTVRANHRDFSCLVRTAIRKSSPDETPVAVGDRVDFTLLDDGTGVIEKVHPRTTCFYRPSKGRATVKQVIAANVEQLAIVAAIDNPPLRPRLIDRLLITAQLGDLTGLVILNKTDLGHSQLSEEVLAGYQSIGIPVLAVSAVTGEGLDQLKSYLHDKISIFAGHSGVGKSSLLNALIPGVELDTSEVSEVSGKGRHTTIRVELHEFPSGGYLVDSPGLRILSLWEVDPAQLSHYFPEMAKFAAHCRFNDCRHISEPDCAVKGAVEKAEIPAFRYESYLRIYDSLSRGEEAEL